MNAYHVYHGSNGAATRRLYRELKLRGAVGEVAASLFRAQKNSRREKKYGFSAGRGGMSFRDRAYEQKGESLKELTELLELHGAALGVTFGWGRDEGCGNPWVLYVEIPSGSDGELQQVSFHSPERYDGPDYSRDWDGRRASESRIIAFCQRVLDAEPVGAQRFEVMTEV